MLIALSIIFFLTSIISVVTGSTSLITVPALLWFNVEPRTAVATNMFALTLMSTGATLPYLRTDALDRERLPALIAMTLFGSVAGAFLLIFISADSIPLLIVVFMIAIVVFSLVRPNAGLYPNPHPSQLARIIGYVLTFLLGIYGGFFSGGYVTLLTAVFVSAFGVSYRQAVATTKVTNIFSSLVATVIFIVHGIVDVELGLILGAAMFAGGIVGARIALRLSNIWLRRIFLAAVVALALKTLFVDVLGVV